MSRKWRWTASLKDCKDFRHGAWERRNGGKVFQVCTMQCGNALQRKLGAAGGVALRVGRHVGLARDDSVYSAPVLVEAEVEEPWL